MRTKYAVASIMLTILLSRVIWADDKLAPLVTTLGQDKIKGITSSVFEDFKKHKVGRDVNVTADFWPAINERISQTQGPVEVEDAQEFLVRGFGGFLQSYTLFELDTNCQRKSIPFSAAELAKYLVSGHAHCDAACNVPPCCGRPSRCRRCK